MGLLPIRRVDLKTINFSVLTVILRYLKLILIDLKGIGLIITVAKTMKFFILVRGCVHQISIEIFSFPIISS